jgi:RNA polymerase sigma factor (sigma-70 family)
MKKFSQIISEGRGDRDAVNLLQTDITQYVNKLKKSLPVDVQKAIYITSKYDITSREVLDEIRTANKSKLKDLSGKHNIPQGDLEDLWNLMKTIKQNYKVMPQYLSASERELIEKGQLALDDATIDLESQTGRNAVSKLYTPLVLHIVNQFKDKSSLDKSSLISAGMLGLANAMNDWKREPDENGGKVVSFKTYAGYRIRQQILNDMDEYSHTLSGTNWYATKKSRDGEGPSLDAASLDNLDDLDHLSYIGAEDRDRDDDSKWKKLYNVLDKTFTQRDTDIFYRFFGINGRTKEKSKDIAKSYGMSEGNIQNSVIKKIIKFIKSNKQLTDMLLDILNIYTESLMRNMHGLTKEQIVETFACDDVYILLEDTTKWSSRDAFVKSYKYAVGQLSDKEKGILNQALSGGFNTIDSSLRAHSDIYKKFMRHMVPTAPGTWTDGDLIENLVSVSDCYLKYKP